MTENKKEKSVAACGYQLRTIYFYLTEGCNLKCRHCWITPKFQTEKTIWPSLNFELFKDIIKQGKELGLSGVKLTGGEPLIHPDIDKILDYVCEESLQLTIETNGVKCTPKIATKIAKGKTPFVSVSLDGADANTHEWVRCVSGSFDAAILGIRNLVHVGIHPQVIMSVMKHNVHQLDAVVRLAEKEKASSVKFNMVLPTAARGEQMHKAEQTLSIKELINLGSWVENVLVPLSKIDLSFTWPTAFRSLNKLATQSGSCCGIFNIIGVLGSGKYALCGIGETIPELVFGNAEKDRLKDIWNNSKILNEIREGLPKKLKGICGDCLMKNHCLASCIAMNYYVHRDLFSSHWFCEEANKIGLFPRTRTLNKVQVVNEETLSVAQYGSVV